MGSWGVSRNKPVATTEASLSAADTFCDNVKIFGNFNVSISGTWSGTVTVQRSFDKGVTWMDVEAFTANAEKRGDEGERDVRYRAGFKSGNYTSGVAAVRISQ